MEHHGVGKRLNDDGVGTEFFEVLEGQVERVGRSIDRGGGDLGLLSLPTSCGDHVFRMRSTPDCVLNWG